MLLGFTAPMNLFNWWFIVMIILVLFVYCRLNFSTFLGLQSIFFCSFFDFFVCLNEIYLRFSAIHGHFYQILRGNWRLFWVPFQLECNLDWNGSLVFSSPSPDICCTYDSVFVVFCSDSNCFPSSSSSFLPPSFEMSCRFQVSPFPYRKSSGLDDAGTKSVTTFICFFWFAFPQLNLYFC